MKSQKTPPFAGLLALLVVAFVAVLLTRGWADDLHRLRAMQVAAKASSETIDMRPLETAQQMAALAVTHSEQDYAKDALRAADRCVDLAFALAIQDATANPAPQTPQIHEMTTRVQTLQAAVAADQARIAQFTTALAKAGPNAKDGLQSLIAIAQAQLSLDQDDLEDAQQDLIRSGGDRQAHIQQLLDQHKTSDAENVTLSNASSAAVELTTSKSLVAQARALLSLHSKDNLLLQAQRDAQTRAAQLSATHEDLEKEVAGGPAAAQQGPAAGSAGTPDSAAPPTALSILRRLTGDKQKLATMDQRISEEQALGSTYGSWNAVVKMREKLFVHGVLVSVFWILLIVVLIMAANHLIGRVFDAVTPERRHLLMFRAVSAFVLQALGLVLILIVILGMSSNIATVVALAGAGLTVALKDFIVGFLGWFVLMGKDGIRPGDWVEINGVGGEVLEVGFLYTMLLETGNWIDPGHPTGRKVSFVNSFAIEGHYFNFSTAGQWLWDEIQVTAPEGVDPYDLAEAIRKIAADETEANAKIAEEEWNRVARAHAGRTFSAAPSLTVQPAGAGVTIVLRYITRAVDRYEVRTRLYREVVDLLRTKKIPESAASVPAAPATPAGS
jgi:small-conductance mechanosensitive channel